MRFSIRLAALAAALWSAGAHAQDTAPAPAAPATAPASAAPPPAPKVDLADAYRKEFAFLEAQKRELAARLAQTRTSFDTDRQRLEREVSVLEDRVLAARVDAESINARIAAAERQEEAVTESRDLLSGTLAQAEASLAGAGDPIAESETYRTADEAGKLSQLFAAGSRKLAELGSLRKSAGKFYLQDGTEVDGTLIQVGSVMTWGISDRGAGVLAPAGGGRFKLWNQPSDDTARALAEGRLPEVLKAYVYESTTTAVEPPVEKTFWGEMAKGGAIGWVILILGALGLLLIAVRAVFLQRAGAAVDKIMEAVSPLVKAQRIPEAIDACKRFKGSAARVVTAALRNADRDREHLEDIVSESILHESTHLNRFGGFITTITAVAPLLGLLGTVTGMIQTFDVITEFGNSDPKMLSGGIAVALVTTEQGLMVAIPCLLLGSLLNGWADGLKDDMEKAALKVINLYQETRAARPARAA